MGTAKRRKERLNQILETLGENRGEMKNSELMGPLLFEWGCTEGTYWSYLETLRAAGKIGYPQAWKLNEDITIKLGE
jgi:hypothetical protein